MAVRRSETQSREQSITSILLALVMEQCTKLGYDYSETCEREHPCVDLYFPVTQDRSIALVRFFAREHDDGAYLHCLASLELMCSNEGMLEHMKKLCAYVGDGSKPVMRVELVCKSLQAHMYHLVTASSVGAGEVTKNPAECVRELVCIARGKAAAMCILVHAAGYATESVGAHRVENHRASSGTTLH